ncbi:TPA: pyridoxal phosphate-dependent aminotransferase [Pseudomonas aeruginosa]|uniref:MalY/PatB family protein n=1 Tax=Pseudomonas TaxID=286 RepID=UPI000CD480B2|nr:MULTISPECIES: MalY/PatB family protein [Pseudomonas]MBH9518266.1 pyridoxal phosphate-dependent aminotransferase [Pseudomonas aeruginosa]MBI8577297.1 pyridoxal phosphate-dependent aminotransferase [Pseudomonas aeruginosa]MBI8804328.1 pyridoxal phosphate-dependent aminotransferase [Pseudomonas aeruginosa]MDA3374412.1 pyridoxal phosphate-dependent aminotransferase [Pseudomonas aeruginosa]MDD2004998.1 pyridoxal phosphate-dependent aminotransferase [Pseudomonas putida]
MNEAVAPLAVPGRSRAPSIFDEVINRKHTNSMKWDCGHLFLQPDESAADPLPMWVADMDFRAPQAVLDALQEAVSFGVFGYAAGASKSYVDAVLAWQYQRFGWEVPREWVMQTSGIITTMKTAIQAFSAPGDSILIQPPVYVHFHEDAVVNGRRLAYAPLEHVGDGYRFDERKFEAAIQGNTRLFILSNPHNPTGNVWSEAELRAMGEICARHGVIVLSDEIHQDFVLNPAKRHIPFASIGEAFAQNSITCTAPSKTFNLPSLQTANVFVPNRRLREELARQYDRNVYRFVNALGVIAGEAAYRHGGPWLEELLGYVRDNHAHFSREIHGATSKIKVLPTDSLYLAWMDCRGLGMNADELDRFMLKEARVWLDKGQKFGVEGHGFMRANLGCSRATLDVAIQRILTAVGTL